MFFKKRKFKKEDDRVWATKTSKFNGICDEILEETGKDIIVLTIAHFEKTLEEMTKNFNERDIKYKSFTSKWDISDFDLSKITQEGIKAIVLLTNVVSNPDQFKNVTWQDSQKGERIHIAVVEHHPLAERDETVLLFAECFQNIPTIRFHVSLDEPIMKIFGSEGITELIKKLGWDENSFISHKMITSAIASAQKKIKKKALGDQRVKSMEEWFYYNSPALREKIKLSF
jgi:preprotein translocase subunit SecA